MIVAVIHRPSGLKGIFSNLAEEFAEQMRALEEALARYEIVEAEEMPEEEPEKSEHLRGSAFSCSRQTPTCHLIPWYTSGFQ